MTSVEKFAAFLDVQVLQFGEALATVQEPRKPIFTPRKITERSTPAPVARAT